MQCVILAAGRGARLMPYTKDVPKPLVEIAGKPLLDHIVSRLPNVVTELVIVIGYKGELIRAHCGDEYYGRPVRYVTQPDYLIGTGDALLRAKPLLSQRFMVLYGDDILGAPGLKTLTEHRCAVSAYPVDTLGRFGPVLVNDDGTMKQIVLGIDNPAKDIPGLAFVGGIVADPSIFDTVPTDASITETLLIDMLNRFATEHAVPIVTHEMWIPIGFPEDIKKAEVLLNE